MTIAIQKDFVPLGVIRTSDGFERPERVYITREWRRALEDMAKLVNEQQIEIAALTARVLALE